VEVTQYERYQTHNTTKQVKPRNTRVVKLTTTSEDNHFNLFISPAPLDAAGLGRRLSPWGSFVFRRAGEALVFSVNFAVSGGVDNSLWMEV
jgi:hypothetical protein